MFTLNLYGVQKQLLFENGGKFSDNELYKASGIEVPAWYKFWKDINSSIDTKIAKPLRENLINFYKTSGYYHVKIQQTETNNSIIFKITPNKPVIITSIKTDIKDQKLKNLMKFKTNDIFKANEFINFRKDLKKELLKEGYCNAIVDTKAIVDIEKNSADLNFKLQKNSICKFRKITLYPPKNISQEVIRSRLLFRENDSFSSKKINRSYSTLSGLEAFDAIQIRTKQESEFIDVDIKLDPKQKRIRQEIGLGYETNYGPRALFHWEERNYNGNAKKISFDLKYSKIEKYIKAGYFWPAIYEIPNYKGYYLDAKDELVYSQEKYENFDEEKLSNYLHLLKDFEFISVDFGVGLERIKIDLTGDSCNVRSGNFFLLFPFAKVIVDTRDSKIDPKNGLYANVEIESGIKQLGSTSSFTKLQTEARVIKTIEPFTFAAKGKLGVISEIEAHLPESKLFFAGGSFSNRGYGYNKLGASDAMCDEAGGKTIIDTTLEVEYPIHKLLYGGVFLDSTMIGKNSFDYSLNFRHSIGMGLRYQTPIGPIKVDFGMDIEDHTKYALHFLIGQSF